MKNYKIFGSVVLMTLLIVTSCSKGDLTITPDAKFKVANFAKYGEMHNDFLTNVNDNFVATVEIENEQQGMDYVAEFNKTYINTLAIADADKALLANEFDKFKSYVYTDRLVAASFGQPYSAESIENVFDKINTLKATNILNEKSAEILTKLSSDLKNNYEGKLSGAQLKANVEALIANFDASPNDPSGAGEFVAIALAISKSSIEWWENNPNAIATDKALPAWLAADLIGGVISGVTAAVGQQIVNGEISWSTVGWSAMAGAISASTGIVGKLVDAIT